MGCCNRRCGLIAGAVFGAAVAILGGVLIPVGNKIIQETVEKEAVIEPGTTAYDTWTAVGAKVYRQFWFFDVKNPLEVVQHGSRPVLVERGPYTYRTRYLPRDNITFNPNETASFLIPFGAIFEPSMSVGPEEDEITSLNLALAVSVLSFLTGLRSAANASLIKNLLLTKPKRAVLACSEVALVSADISVRISDFYDSSLFGCDECHKMFPLLVKTKAEN